MKLIKRAISSEALAASRTVWFEPGDNPATPLCLFLDGEFYLDSMHAQKAIAAMRKKGVLTDRRCVFLSHGGMQARHEDMTCNPRYSQFLVKELIPALSGARKLPADGHLIVGLSLGGLAAAFAAVRFPRVFPRLVSQSPSAWWKDEWLARHLGKSPLGKSRIWVSVGLKETDTDVRHSPTGLHQVANQLDSCRRLTTALQKTQATVRFSTFDGGHDMKCWKKELPDALGWVST